MSESEADRSFPYAKWGMGVAFLGAIMALCAGIFFSIPILIIDSAHDNGDMSLWATILVQAFTGFSFLMVPFFISMNYGGTFRDWARRLGFRRFKVNQAVKWTALGIGVYIVFSIIYSKVIGTPKQDDFTGDFGPIWIQVILIVGLAPLSEEACFRGLLFGGIRTRLPMWAAALLAGLVFGLLHATTGWSAVPVLIVFGAMLCVIYEKTGSIWPGIAIHMLNNAIALAALHS